MCEAVAALVINPAPSTGLMRWTSDDPPTAIADFVSLMMALSPGDPRAAPARALLDPHFQAALAEPGISPTDALRSTFVVACLSPSTVSIGL